MKISRDVIAAIVQQACDLAKVPKCARRSLSDFPSNAEKRWTSG